MKKQAITVKDVYETQFKHITDPAVLQEKAKQTDKDMQEKLTRLTAKENAITNLLEGNQPPQGISVEKIFMTQLAGKDKNFLKQELEKTKRKKQKISSRLSARKEALNELENKLKKEQSLQR